MKLKNLVKRITAWALVCITIAGSTPAVDVHAEDTSNSKVDIYATQSSDYLITIPKQLILDGKSGTGAYRVSVKGNISGTDIITVTPDERFFMKQEGKTDILTTIEQIKTQFTYADGVRPEVEVTADGKVQMEKISAGKWTGLFNFNITSSVDLESEDSVGSTIDDIKGNGTGKDTAQNKYSEYITTGAIVNIPVSAKNEKGEDINATSSNIVGSKAEDLLDSLKETGHIEDTEEVDALIEVKSDDFDGLAETTFDVSNIAQPGDEVIILHYDETKQMWEFIGQETVTEEGTVTGDFTSYSPVAFVKVDKKGEIKPHFHNYRTSIKDATCVLDGLMTYICDECDHKTDVTIDKLGHNHISSIVPPTCTENGYTLYVCSRCNNEYKDDTVNATGHTVVKVGTSEIHEKCSTCGVTLSDKHELTNEVLINPTCTEKGTTKYSCECGYTFNEQDIDALGHTPVNGGTVSVHEKCSVCNETLETQHTYTESIVTNVTCTTAGLKKYTCNCGYSKTEEVAFVGHSYGDYVTTTQATCTVDGVKTKTCTVCGNKETAPITKLGHSFSSTYTTDKESTCTVAGSKSQHCSRCNATQNVTTIPALEHSYGTPTYTWTGYTACKGSRTCSTCNNVETANATITNAVTKTPTCTATGTKTYTAKFSNTTFSTQTKNETLSKDANNHTGSVVNGGTSGVHTKYSCCGAIASTTHSYSNSVAVAATCTTKGTTKYTCGCGYSYTSQNIAINSSNHTGNSVNGGTSGVHTKYSCCGATISSSHSYTVDSGTQYSAATCTAPRYNYKRCSCGYNPKSSSYTVATGSKNTSNHTGSVVNGGTSGVHTKYNCCGATVSTTHSYTKSTQTAATCTVKGTSKYTCSCGYYYTSQDIAVLGHSYSSYSTSGTQHWKACTRGCGTKSALGNHADSGTDGLCDVCGYKGTIVYTYHTHNDATCYKYSTTKSCQMCAGKGKKTCTPCGGVGYFTSATCGGKVIILGSSGSYPYNCGICGGGTAGSTHAQCEKCGKQYSSGGYSCACGSSSSGYIPNICGETKTDCSNCTNGYVTCSFCKGSNSNLVSVSCADCSGKGTIVVATTCGGTPVFYDSTGGSTYCSTCGGGGYTTYIYYCNKCGTKYTATSYGCGCGSGSSGYIPQVCGGTTKDCPTCVSGKVYRVGDCGKTTSTVESQYTKFE